MATVIPHRSLVVQQWRSIDRIRERVIGQVVREFRTAGFDGGALDRSVALVLDGQSTIVAATDASLSLAAGVSTGTGIEPIGIDPAPLIGRAGRSGTLLEVVYSRPGKVAAEDTVTAALSYLRGQVLMDLQLAQRAAAHAHVMADQRVIGWRRQTNPAGGKTCGFCIAAATRVYGKIERISLHHHCRCTVTEVYSDDPIRGTVIDRERLDAVYAASGGRTDRATLGRLRFADTDLPPTIDSDSIAALRALHPRVIEHPELGELLTGDRHDTGFDLAA